MRKRASNAKADLTPRTHCGKLYSFWRFRGKETAMPVASSSAGQLCLQGITMQDLTKVEPHFGLAPANFVLKHIVVLLGPGHVAIVNLEAKVFKGCIVCLPVQVLRLNNDACIDAARAVWCNSPDSAVAWQDNGECPAPSQSNTSASRAALHRPEAVRCWCNLAGA